MVFAMVNGQETAALSVFDRGLQFGDGVFETMLCLAGKPRYFEEHWQRLQQGCQKLDIALPAIQQKIAALVLQYGSQRAVAKLIVTRGATTRGYRCPSSTQPDWILTINPFASLPRSAYTAGVRVRLCQTRLPLDPQLAGIKHLNRLHQVLARKEWEDEYHDGLLQNYQGEVIEACASNVFAIIDDKILTPDLSSAGVQGIVRKKVLEYCELQKIFCAVQPLTVSDLCRAQEVFLTNSVYGILPVASIDNQSFTVGSLTLELLEAMGGAAYFAD